MCVCSYSSNANFYLNETDFSLKSIIHSKCFYQNFVIFIISSQWHLLSAVSTCKQCSDLHDNRVLVSFFNQQVQRCFCNVFHALFPSQP